MTEQTPKNEQQDPGMAPQEIQITAYPITTLCIERLSKMSKIMYGVLFLFAAFCFWQATKTKMLRDVHMLLSLLCVSIGFFAVEFNKLIARSLEELRDQAQPAQSSVVLKRERMTSNEET